MLNSEDISTDLADPDASAILHPYQYGLAPNVDTLFTMLLNGGL